MEKYTIALNKDEEAIVKHAFEIGCSDDINKFIKRILLDECCKIIKTEKTVSKEKKA